MSRSSKRQRSSTLSIGLQGLTTGQCLAETGLKLISKEERKTRRERLRGRRRRIPGVTMRAHDGEGLRTGVTAGQTATCDRDGLVEVDEADEVGIGNAGRIGGTQSTRARSRATAD